MNVAPSLIVTACQPYAMNSADPTLGSYTVAGTFTDIHHETSVRGVGFADAFAARIDSTGNAKLVPYYDHFPAALYGVNSSGTAIGFSYQQPPDFRTPLSGKEPIVYTVAPEIMTILLPGACPAYGCWAPPQQSRGRFGGEPLPECAFGGCTINDARRATRRHRGQAVQ